ncbi:MAG: hypothetical protein NC908_04700 [Candidatus Omnitrophica bacterium]|nr:hypothetical protein [Candidatus Omnitrophota bacterium]
MLDGLPYLQAKTNNLNSSPPNAVVALAEDYYTNLPAQTKRLYEKLAAIIGTPTENLTALELAETDGRDKAVSRKGAVGPLQITPRNLIILVNTYIAEIKGLIAQDKKLSLIDAHHYTTISQIEKLIGPAPFSWERMCSDPDSNRTVGAVSFAMNFRLFYKWKLVPLKRVAGDLCAAHPGRNRIIQY